MNQRKSDKELAFLHDLYIAPDWGERFAELVDANIQFPKEGAVLYIEAGTGGHAMALQERGGPKLELLCVDENEENLEVARVKATALRAPTKFQYERARALSFADDQFDVVLMNASLAGTSDLQQTITEAVRVTKPGGTVAAWLPTASSFGEFFSIYWEALQTSGVTGHETEIEHLITDLPAVSDVESWTEQAGVVHIASWTAIEEFDYESGKEFFNSPLISDFLLPNWLQFVPESEHDTVLRELGRIIDEERHNGEFVLTLKATLVTGRKAHIQ
jgi:ubiquinone/menaquinone biosynthesis C-methylase UbiE